ncbi:MAG: signal peptidase I [Lachnospiraceae bacterium]|nr:signal peptidase I [Lachnospiraceae bacterium]
MNEYEEANNLKVSEEKESKAVKGFIWQAVETIVYFIGIFLCVILLQRYVVQPVEVDGRSMEATLYNADHLLLEKLSYRFSDPERFDVVVFRHYEDGVESYYIKRIIGLPGETVRIEDSVIYINGEVLVEDFGKDDTIRFSGIAIDEIIIGEDEYFVLGDNRNNSKDSRDPEVGLVSRESIAGRAWVRIWPLGDFGLIRHE